MHTLREFPPTTRWMRTAWILAVACLSLVSSCGAIDNGGNSSQAVTTAPALGDIDAELEFFGNLGNGTITIIEDENLDDIACAHFGVGSGQFVIAVNPNVMNSVAQPVQDFFLMHEYGHIYLKHLIIQDPNKRASEHLADAYAIRVLAAVSDTSYVNLAIDYFEVSGVLPGPNHPSHQSRAFYQMVVLSAYISSPDVVPPVYPTFGTLLISNPLAYPVSIYVNGAQLGSLNTGQSDAMAVYGDPVYGDDYLIQLINSFNGLLVLDGTATVYAPGTTAWPSFLVSGGSERSAQGRTGTMLGPEWDYFTPADETSHWDPGTRPNPFELVIQGDREWAECCRVSGLDKK